MHAVFGGHIRRVCRQQQMCELQLDTVHGWAHRSDGMYREAHAVTDARANTESFV
jgi:hypothetical protein